MVEPIHLKNMLVKLGSSSPKFRGENKKSLKPPPRLVISPVLGPRTSFFASFSSYGDVEKPQTITVRLLREREHTHISYVCINVYIICSILICIYTYVSIV